MATPVAARIGSLTGPLGDGLMDTSSINAQSIFDDNAATLKLSWLTGHEGWERGFSADTVANATSSADLVGHLNLIHPNRIQVLGEAEIDYYQRQTDEDRSRHMAELIALEPPFLVVAGGAAAPPELVLRCTRSSTRCSRRRCRPPR